MGLIYLGFALLLTGLAMVCVGTIGELNKRPELPEGERMVTIGETYQLESFQIMHGVLDKDGNPVHPKFLVIEPRASRPTTSEEGESCQR